MREIISPLDGLRSPFGPSLGVSPIIAAGLFDRGAVVDVDGYHGGRGVPEISADWAFAASLFDFGAYVADDGFHGGAGVDEGVLPYTPPVSIAPLFDAAAVINLAGFHGGAGVTEQ
jgi:hypothetical protein